ncbi:MAG TPA: S-type pyocin family protein [Brevundimonas sp.]|nr:S-type pyocin family protein [Brevundimonas sp.]
MIRMWMTAAAASLGLVACGNGDSALETRDRSGAGVAPAAAEAAAPATAAVPVLTANRQETVDAKVTRLFERNGADFNARTAEDYLERVERFTRQPPDGTERIERPNGDVLLYQPSTNTFAVVSRDGVPKTMFKPRDGATYWAEQKARAPTFGQRRASPEG